MDGVRLKRRQSLDDSLGEAAGSLKMLRLLTILNSSVLLPVLPLRSTAVARN